MGWLEVLIAHWAGNRSRLSYFVFKSLNLAGGNTNRSASFEATLAGHEAHLVDCLAA